MLFSFFGWSGLVWVLPLLPDEEDFPWTGLETTSAADLVVFELDDFASLDTSEA